MTQRVFFKKGSIETGEIIEYEEYAEQNGGRKKCCKRIPADQLRHEGHHSCIDENHDDYDENKEFHFCGAKEEEEKVYCTLPLWHEDWKESDGRPNGLTEGYTSSHGHFFPCTHGKPVGSENIHTFLIVDISGSMNSKDLRPSSFDWLNRKKDLPNRLGLVIEACQNYVSMRSKNSRDKVTFITFENYSEVLQ